MSETNPKIKEALNNPDIPHIHFDNLIWETIELRSSEMEEKGYLFDFVFVALENGKAVATLRISGPEFSKLKELHSLENFKGTLN